MRRGSRGQQGGPTKVGPKPSSTIPDGYPTRYPRLRVHKNGHFTSFGMFGAGQAGQRDSMNIMTRMGAGSWEDEVPKTKRGEGCAVLLVGRGVTVCEMDGGRCIPS